MERRKFMGSTAAAVAGAGLAACATGQSSTMQTGVRTPFAVKASYIPIVGSDEMFPVRRIYCIGRNYAAHAIERGSDPTREPPFFFQKPSDAIQHVPASTVGDHPYPSLTKNYHYEAELVAVIGKGGRDIHQSQALDHVYGYTLGLDMTSFDHSAVLGAVHPAAQIGHFTKGAIWLKVNGNLKQNADLSQMIWSVAEQVSKLSEANELYPGDVIYSGTPANVGPVVKGDVIEMHIDRLPNLSVRIV
jgi:fumarylpyruvate hydrolase